MAVTPTQPQFDPQAWAAHLIDEVLPGIARGQHWAGWTEVRRRGEDPAVHREALVAATHDLLAPPDKIGRRVETYRILSGMVAFRAFTDEMVSGHTDIHERYRLAAHWICEYIGSIVWWNCHE